MARKTVIELVDDINGGQADETVTFGLDGVTYEIDLSEENATRLRADFDAWVGHARRAGGRRQRGSRSSSGSSAEIAAIRQWARENGYEVSDRGRISARVREAYAAR